MQYQTPLRFLGLTDFASQTLRRALRVCKDKISC